MVWDDIVRDNIYVICNTPMAVGITRRTLFGFRDVDRKANIKNEQLITRASSDQEALVNDLKSVGFWKGNTSKQEMKFNAVVGNPPYQQDTDGAGRQAIPLYNLFVDIAKYLYPDNISMIMPARWYAGGMGLDKFRDSMKSDRHIYKIVDYVNAKDCFPNISISGGICYFLWKQSYCGQCMFTNIKNDIRTTDSRYLDEFNVIVRYNEALSIIRKVKSLNQQTIDSIISPLMPFGLSTNVRGRMNKSNVDSLRLLASDGISYLSVNEVSKGKELIHRYKVFMSKMSAEHAGEPDKNGMFSVFTKTMKVGVPNDICTHSYFVIGSYDTEIESVNTLKYLQTKFVRCIVSITLSAVNLSKLVFFNVPLQDFTSSSDIDWSQSISDIDRQLYSKYGLSDDEIAFIEKMIKPME